MLLLLAACSAPTPLAAGGRPVTEATAERPALHDFRGLFHVHGESSHDSSGDLDDVLDAAQAAGADFVWVTDHNSRDAAPWQGMHGQVLVLVAEERSRPEGHLVVLPPDGTSIPAQATTDEVMRATRDAGGFCVVAHPDRPSRPWEDRGVFDDRVTHLEVFSVATLVKTHKLALAWRLPWLAVSATAALRSMVERPDRTLAMWDRLLETHAVTGVASVDLHFRWYIPERAVARLASTHVLAEELSVESIHAALRDGRAYMAFECFGDALGFDFHLATTAGRREFLHVTVPAEARVDLFRDGERWWSRVLQGALELPVPGPGVYRVEVYRDDRPWVLSNPVYVRP